MFFNSAAFALAGITRDTPDPAGGTIARNAKGEPDGRVTDNAVDLFYKDSVRPRMEVPPSLERASEAAAFMSKQFVRYGLTSVHHSGGSFAALRAIRAQGRLVHRANYESDPAMVDSLIAAGIGTEKALAATLLFRLVSFWLPLPVGAAAGWWFRRRYPRTSRT